MKGERESTGGGWRGKERGGEARVVLTAVHAQTLLERLVAHAPELGWREKEMMTLWEY